MSNTGKPKRILFLIILFVVPAFLCFAFYFYAIRQPIVNRDSSIFVRLPYFGEKTIKPNSTDTIFHTIPAFSLTNQDGKTFTDKDLDGKIYVADFFFASCKSICPEMATSLIRVQDKVKHIKNFAIVSHTVDPQNDNVEVIKAYSYKVHANPKVWTFLTGDKKTIYDLGNLSYLVNVVEKDVTPDFLHSEFFVLVDKEKHIRGFYDGTNLQEVNRLIDEIKVLNAEYAFAKEKKN